MLRHRAPSDRTESAARLGDVLRSGDGGRARLRGDVVHDWLERLPWVEEGLPADDELRRVAARRAPALAPEEVEELLEGVRGAVEAPEVRRLLSREAATRRARDLAGDTAADVRAEREWPFLRRDDGEVVTGRVDRLTLYGRPGSGGEEADWVAADVIDFKTDDPGDGAGALAEAADRYRPQLEAYRRAAADLHGIPLRRVRGWLLFLPAGRAVEVG